MSRSHFFSGVRIRLSAPAATDLCPRRASPILPCILYAITRNSKFMISSLSQLLGTSVTSKHLTLVHASFLTSSKVKTFKDNGEKAVIVRSWSNEASRRGGLTLWSLAILTKEWKSWSTWGFGGWTESLYHSPGMQGMRTLALLTNNSKELKIVEWERSR